MKKQILNVLLTAVFTMIISSGFSAAAQSINASRPTPLMSRTMSGTISGVKTYYYSVRARRGAVVTVNAKVAWTRGVSFSLDFRGMPGRGGGQKHCCDGDSYLFLDHGSNGTQEMEKSFTAVSDDEFLMIFSFNTPNLKYTFTFDGIELDSDDDESDETYDADAIIVPGTSGNNWVNTGIRVRRGDVVTLIATGRVDVNAGWGIHDARGTRNFAAGTTYPVSSRTRYGLAAKIVPDRGATTQKWSYGDARRMVVAKDGTLYLTANDDAPDDNSGEYEVTVKVRRSR